MVNHRQEILRNKLERVNSLYFSFCKGDIKKAEDAVIYNEDDFKIPKTGKEIKDKLQREYILKEESKDKIYKQLNKLVEEIGEPPDDYIPNYLVSKWRGKLDIPRVYSRGKIYDENYNKFLGAESKIKYNDLAKEFLNVSIECKKLYTVINNIDEKKKFNLTAKLASKIGF